MIILILILLLIICICLIDRDLQRYKKTMNKKYNALVKRMKILTHNQDNAFDYITEIYNELERSDNYEKNEEC